MSAEQSTSLDIQGRVFTEMIEHWQLTKPTVVAHDFGGATTLRAHLLHGAEFERYILMNVVAMRPWGSDFFDHVGRHVEAFVGVPDHIHAAIVSAYIAGALAHDIDAADFDALTRPWLSSAGRSSFYRQFAQADEKYTAEVEGGYKDIRCPTQVLWGEDDPWIPIDRGKALNALIGQRALRPMPGVGHLPQIEAPELVTKEVLGFIDQDHAAL